MKCIRIKSGTFIKVLQPKDNPPEEFYVVFFPVRKAEEVGQQLSKIFLSYRECEWDVLRSNSFKAILLKKCEGEFNKKNIYDGWKEEKKAYEAEKGKLSERDRLEKEEELEFRRMEIKKQVLGNIWFIGELFKKDMLVTPVMRFCIESLLKLEENSPNEFTHINEDMDEDDHEALCTLFTTIGYTINQGKTRPYIDMCFKKIEEMSNDKKNLGSRSRFMYKDLIELRHNNWVARREE